MALIKCKECGKEISDSVKSCPHCGYVYKEEKKMTTGKVIKIVIIMAIVGIALFFGGTYLFFDWLPNVKIDNEIKSFYGTYELIESDVRNLNGTEYENLEIKKEITIDESNSIKDGDLINTIGYGNFESGFGFSKDDKLGIFVVVSLDQISNTDKGKHIKLDFDKDGDYLYLVNRANVDNIVGLEKMTIKYQLKK